MKSILKNPKKLALIVAITGIICCVLAIATGAMTSVNEEILTVQICAIFPGYLIVIYMLLLYFNKLNNVKTWNIVLLAILIISAIASFITIFGTMGFANYMVSNFYLIFGSSNSIMAISYIHLIAAVVYYILSAIVILGIILKKNLAHKLLNYICVGLMAISVVFAIVLSFKDSEVIKVTEMISAVIGPIGMLAFSLFLESYSASVIKEN